MGRAAKLLGILLLAAPLAVLLLAAKAGLAPALGFLGDPVRGLWFYSTQDPRPSGTLALPGLEAPVRVVYDQYGVPHIYAQNEHDLYLAFGYVQACDRLWQMDLLRRITEGRLAELVGEPGLESDRLMWSLGMPRVVDESLKAIEELAANGDNAAAATLEALKAYAEGVNRCIESLRGRDLLPPEYRLLGVEPEPWTPRDSIAVAKLIDYVLAFKDTDIYWGLLAGANGGWVLGLYADYIRWLNETGRSILDNPGEAFRLSNRLPEGWATRLPLAEPRDAVKLNYTVSLEALYRALTSGGPRGLKLEPVKGLLEPVERVAPWLRGIGFSNNWAVTPRLSVEDTALLANDPHLELTAPPIWYLVHLSSADGVNVYGAAFPGVPFVIIGRTRGLAFGYTNSFIDVTDFYYYRWSGGRYYYQGRLLEPEKETVELRVNRPGRGYTVYRFTVYRTVHGPLITVHAGSHNVTVAVKSTVLVPEPIAVWAYLMNHAETVWDALEAQRYFYSPIQNMVAVDTQGHVLYSPSGLVPVRSRTPLVEAVTSHGRLLLVNTGFLPFNGSRGEGEWIGYLPFNRVPHVLDPARGWVATANNLISAEFTPIGRGPYLQWDFLDSYRWLRIASLLETLSQDGVDLDDMRRIQLDVASEAAARILPLVEALSQETAGGRELELLSKLNGWDHQMLRTRAEPSIAFEILRRLLWASWREAAARAGLDPLDPRVAGYITRLELVEYALREALRGDTFYIEKMSGMKPPEVVSEALTAALRDLEDFYKTGNIDQWRWGRAHRLLVKHPMGSKLPWLNLGPYEVDGGPYTVNVAPISKLGDMVTVGPSLRLIAAAKAPADRAALVSLPGGESGIFLSPHYGDLLQLWLLGRYIDADMTANPQGVEQTATLTPAG